MEKIVSLTVFAMLIVTVFSESEQYKDSEAELRNYDAIETDVEAKLNELSTLLKKYQDSEKRASDDRTGDVSSRSCDVTAMNRCTEDLVNKFSNGDILLTRIYSNTMTKFCDSVSAADRCVQKTAGCIDSNDRQVQLRWKGVSDSLAYICKDGKAGLTKFQKCVTTQFDAYFADILACLATIPGSSVGCSAHNAKLTCYGNAAKKNCDSFLFAKTYYIKAFQPETAVNFGCTITYQARTRESDEEQKRLSEQFEIILHAMNRGANIREDEAK